MWQMSVWRYKELDQRMCCSAESPGPAQTLTKLGLAQLGWAAAVHICKPLGDQPAVLDIRAD